MTMMSFRITGDGVDVTEPLRVHAKKLFEDVVQNCTATPTVDVVLTYQPHSGKDTRHLVSAKVRADGKKTINRSVATDDMYKSLNEVAMLVGREIVESKKKQILSPRHHLVRRKKTA